MFGRKKLKHDNTLLDWVADCLLAGGMRIGIVDYDKGTMRIQSTTQPRITHTLKLERVK